MSSTSRCHKPWPLLLALLMALALASLCSCQQASDARTSIVEACQKSGQRCRHSSGQVGYCTIDKAGGLRCMSQH